MGELATAHGYNDAAESLMVIDPTEGFIFQVLPDDVGGGTATYREKPKAHNDAGEGGGVSTPTSMVMNWALFPFHGSGTFFLGVEHAHQLIKQKSKHKTKAQKKINKSNTKPSCDKHRSHTT